MRILRSAPLALAGATLAVALSVSALSANAASTFLLQFGQHDTEAQARQQWDSLQGKFPDLLGDMSVRIAPITNNSGAESYRTQASGVDSREQAQAACAKLSAANESCVVVETSMYMPNDSVAENDEPQTVDVTENATADFDAAIAQQQPAVEAPKTRSFRDSILPWLRNDSETASAADAAPVEQVQTAQAAPAPRPERINPPANPQPIDRATAASMSADLKPGETRVVPSRAPRTLNSQVAAAAPAPQATAPAPAAQAVAPQVAPAMEQEPVGQAEVEVAEAIQVPLSFAETAPVPVNKPVGYGGYPSQPLPKTAVWVQLSQFSSKEAAMNYWRMLSNQNPEMMRMMRVRIVSPWQTRGFANRTASLRMGPFESQAAIDNLCISAARQKLRCSLVKEVGSSSTANVVRTQSAPADRYNRRMATSRSYSRMAGQQPNGMFWVQLGAFGSVTEAQQRWGEMSTVHTDLLGRLQPQISYPSLSSSPTPVYHLRTGPFVSKASAMNLCSSLQNRHMGCVIVQAR